MSKEVKDMLKKAKEAIKNKDFKTSLSICKNILRADKTNYVALVLLGVSMQDKPDAVMAYRKAAKLDPTQVLAWQGLVSFYEKNDNPDNKVLIEAYTHLIELETDLKKLSEFCEKLVILTLQEPTEIETIAKFLSTQLEKIDDADDKCNMMSKYLVQLLDQYKTIPTEFCETYEKALRSLLETKATTSSNHYKKYLKLLFRQQKLELLIQESKSMHSIYTQDVYPLEWICKIYAESEMENTGVEVPGIEEYILKLLDFNSDSTMALLAQAATLYKDEKYIECRDLIHKVIELQPAVSLHTWFLLLKCSHKLHSYLEVEKAAEEAFKLISNSSKYTHLVSNVNVLLCDAQSRSDVPEKWLNVVKRCENITETNPKLLISLARALTLMKNYEEADKILQQISDPENPEIKLIKSYKLKQENQVNEALEMLQSDSNVDNVDILIETGKCYWEQKKFSESFIKYLEAAKLDQNYYIPFLYLGQYYVQVNDLDKARRCYQRAFKLNPKCNEAGISLSNIYRTQKNWVANQQLLENVTCQSIDNSSKWAWLQLGLHHLEQKNYTDAIDNLRSVIRADPNDNHAWESLADAYVARGAYTAAMKSYTRACELSPTILYPKLQIAWIKQLLGEFSDAKKEYEEILTTNSNYVPALKGLADTCLSLAKVKYREQLLGLARDYAQMGIDTISIALKQRNDLSCLWKILADCCNLIAIFPGKYCVAHVLSGLALNTSDNEAVLLREELFNLATRCYSRALNLANSEILLWYDIASNYYLQSKFLTDSNQTTELHQKSLAIAKHCVTSKPQMWQAWNLLGIVAVELNLYKLAQHSFIKAVNLEKNNACAWTNLGALYLKLEEPKLANEAFTFAQRAQPNYVQCWVGQAMTAELLSYNEAMDLFRHCAQIGPDQDQAEIGYANWVCSTLIKYKKDANDMYSIRNMHAIPVATDCVEWYAQKHPEDSCAWNILGLLKERQKLYQSAAKAFKHALKVVDSESHKNIVLSNLGRVCISLGEYTEAISYFEEITEASFVSSCGLALACFKAEVYEKSYTTYETALEWLAPDDHKKSHILVAMSSIAYMFHGPEDAKTLLFQCLQLKPPSVSGLFAACALGLLHGDLQLAQLVLKELDKFSNNKFYLSDISDLKSMNLLVQNEHKKAKVSLSHDLHKHPNEARIWLSISRLLLKLNISPEAASRCALAALECGRTVMDVSKILGLVSLSEIMNGRNKSALIIAQKAVHSYPTVADGWSLLIASILPFCTVTSKLEWLRQVISYVRRQVVTTKALAQWLSNHERKVTMMVEELKTV